MKVPSVLPVLAFVLCAALAGCLDDDAPSDGCDGCTDTATNTWAPRDSAPDAAPAASNVATKAPFVCSVCDHALVTGPYTWEPSGAVDPTDGDHYAVAFRADDPSIEVHVTFDAGHNWTRSVIPLTHGDDPYTNAGDAVVFFAPDGTLYVGGLGIRYRPDPATGSTDQRAGADIIVSRSDDGGITFQEPVVVASGGGTKYTATAMVSVSDDYQNQDRPWFAAGPDGRLLAAWNELGTDGYYANVAGNNPFPYDGNVY